MLNHIEFYSAHSFNYPLQISIHSTDFKSEKGESLTHLLPTCNFSCQFQLHNTTWKTKLDVQTTNLDVDEIFLDVLELEGGVTQRVLLYQLWQLMNFHHN